MAIDPICGMTVDEATARSAERDGRTAYFCSERCRQKFLSSGSSEKPQVPHHHQGHHERTSQTKAAEAYTCPMHPEVISDKPGSCPKCGMALELVRPTAKKTNLVYTCPMHPEIIQDGPIPCRWRVSRRGGRFGGAHQPGGRTSLAE